ncbi:hypothetical protein [Candidatus Uabimicrobium sp. HlEnr_7]|uniref:hypothetical protein n=1 Tax=Candidatus Uabimicrobium helgolandensis TaxID=3095367 RepID=UPI003556055B
MNTLWGFTAAKKILHFEIDEKLPRILIRACPATLIGWVLSFFVRSNETTIKINKNLFVSDEWGFFRRKIMYIPVKSITSISMRERFRTVLLFCAIFCFVVSMLLIYASIPFSVSLRVALFIVGVVSAVFAFVLKQRVFITIYRGNHIHELNFRANQKDLIQLKAMLEMIMFLSTGGEKQELKKIKDFEEQQKKEQEQQKKEQVQQNNKHEENRKPKSKKKKKK